MNWNGGRIILHWHVQFGPSALSHVIHECAGIEAAGFFKTAAAAAH